MQTRLNLNPAVVREARELAARAGQPIVEMAKTHTTVSVERAVLRLAGLQGADPDGMPWVNRLVDAVRETIGLEHGVALPAFDALLTGGYDDLGALAEAAASGKRPSASRPARPPPPPAPPPALPSPRASAGSTRTACSGSG